jgi:hypothetical protein
MAVDRRQLPAGEAESAKGTIAGIPTTTGTYGFTVAVTDSAIPGLRAQRTFAITVTSALTVEWKTPPAVHGQELEGSVVVNNLTAQDVTLTVIVVGVNQIGRATALGYQEFTLTSGKQQVIPFGSSPGPGTYVVHADAVAKSRVRTPSIARANRRQTRS